MPEHASTTLHRYHGRVYTTEVQANACTVLLEHNRQRSFKKLTAAHDATGLCSVDVGASGRRGEALVVAGLVVSPDTTSTGAVSLAVGAAAERLVTGRGEESTTIVETSGRCVTCLDRKEDRERIKFPMKKTKRKISARAHVNLKKLCSQITVVI